MLVIVGCGLLGSWLRGWVFIRGGGGGWCFFFFKFRVSDEGSFDTLGRSTKVFVLTGDFETVRHQENEWVTRL